MAFNRLMWTLKERAGSNFTPKLVMTDESGMMWLSMAGRMLHGECCRADAAGVDLLGAVYQYCLSLAAVELEGVVLLLRFDLFQTVGQS